MSTYWLYTVGELTDELAEYKIDPSDSPFISRFVAIAPKAYSYIIHRNKHDKIGKQIVKQKGYQITKQSAEVIQFDTYLDILKGNR